MKTKLGASLIAALMLMGLFGAAAQAAPGDNGKAGPNDKNNKGLCTAYFNGSDTGRANKRNAPPFVGLENAAVEAGESVAVFCGATEENGEVTDPGPIGGNPDFGGTEDANPNSRGGRDSE